MGKITVVNNITLDGVMQASARADEDTRNGFTHGGWGLPYQDATLGKMMGERMASSEGALLFGRRTYEDFYSVWPKRTGPITDHLNQVQKYVVSSTMKEPLPWQNSTLIKDDVIRSVTALKQKDDKSITILGSGALIRSLIPANLIDEYLLLIFPIVLGSGQRLFPEGHLLRLELVHAVTTPKGVILATYRQPAGV